MSVLRKILLLLGIGLILPVAQAEPAKEETIRKLIALHDMSGLQDAMSQQVLVEIRQGLKAKGLIAEPMTPQQQQIVEQAELRTLEVLHRHMNEQTLQSLAIKVQSQVYTEEELQAIIAFLQTPAGQAMLKKEPVALTLMMTEMQSKLADMRPEAEQIGKELGAALLALRSKPGKPAMPAKRKP
ncbi:DUF2059 domain-containing protein [Leeia aquatica]|uniref:DUF2059 domain-containing protein n=1 Tax=Leeia aquatica TaxID=2725557 RepID=A0A847SFJ3_9NEIS|nr:DUF2059 domain-containing protein [Leeia aquatica]NLR76029.1 DUF2059 domain-containing protein [Leeia aquatica]